MVEGPDGEASGTVVLAQADAWGTGALKALMALAEIGMKGAEIGMEGGWDRNRDE